MAQSARPVRPPTGPPVPRTPNLLMRVWDAPIRLFHWAIVLLVLLSYVSSQKGWIQVHFWSGYAVLALLAFRLVWGFVGSDTALFRNFLQSPLAAFHHLGTFFRREPDREIGHNAAGGWMVLVLLLAILAQVVTGLFTYDDVVPEGPLGHLVSSATGNRMTSWHIANFYYVLLTLMALHVVAVFAYALFKRHDLVRPMVTGKKRLPANMRQPRFTSPLLAVAILAVAAGLVWALIRFA